MLHVSLPCAGHAALELHKGGHERIELPLGALQLLLHLRHLLPQLGALAHAVGSELVQLCLEVSTAGSSEGVSEGVSKGVSARALLMQMHSGRVAALHRGPKRVRTATPLNTPTCTCAICRSLVCTTSLYVCLPLIITSCVSASASRSELISCF